MELYSTIQNSTIQFSEVLYTGVHYSAVKCGTLQYNTNSTIQFSAVLSFRQSVALLRSITTALLVLKLCKEIDKRYSCWADVALSFVGCGLKQAHYNLHWVVLNII